MTTAELQIWRFGVESNALVLFKRRGDGCEIIQPWHGGLIPNLPLWRQLGSLIARAYAHADKLWAFTHRCAVHLRAAVRTKNQFPLIATCSYLHVCLRFPSHFEVVISHSKRGAKGTARNRLAIGAMANTDLARVNRGCIADSTAMTLTIDFHVLSPRFQTINSVRYEKFPLFYYPSAMSMRA